MALKTRQELYDIIKAEAQVANPQLTDFEEGSILDAIVGATATALSEIVQLIVKEFNKTYFDLANGPEVTGGEDELENLAVDQYGEDFERPKESYSVGIVKFSRANTSAGNVIIPAGTIVKTQVDSNGQSQRFKTLSDVILTGTSINASAQAVEPGPKGNVGAGQITVIETTLTDPSVIVTNESAFSGGAPRQDDQTYRQTIRNLIKQLKGATAGAIQAKALTVPGIVHAQAIEEVKTVIEWDPAAQSTIGTYFKLPVPKLYVADANGEANDALLGLVRDAVHTIRACGVKIDIVSAIAYPLNWKAAVTLNTGGPNFATLQDDLSMIIETMEKYLHGLPVGAGFDRNLANAAMMAIWGPNGTNDITAFVTSVPTGNVASVTGQKIIPGTVTIE